MPLDKHHTAFAAARADRAPIHAHCRREQRDGNRANPAEICRVGRRHRRESVGRRPPPLVARPGGARCARPNLLRFDRALTLAIAQRERGRSSHKSPRQQHWRTSSNSSIHGEKKWFMACSGRLGSERSTRCRYKAIISPARNGSQASTIRLNVRRSLIQLDQGEGEGGREMGDGGRGGEKHRQLTRRN